MNCKVTRCCLPLTLQWDNPGKIPNSAVCKYLWNHYTIRRAAETPLLHHRNNLRHFHQPYALSPDTPSCSISASLNCGATTESNNSRHYKVPMGRKAEKQLSYSLGVRPQEVRPLSRTLKMYAKTMAQEHGYLNILSS